MGGATEQVRDFLRHKSLQCTRQREHILHEVLASEGHFDADDLCERLRRRHLRVSRATVYRTLPLLEEGGLIRQVFRVGGRVQYELRAPHHDHMLCIRCGKTIEFKDERIEDLQRDVCDRHGFKPIEHRMGIRGICRACRRRTGRGGEPDGRIG